MICLDNSDYMRNGDYTPTRLDAQQDAAGVICNDRTNNNPESTVGILTTAGNGVDLLVSPTEDIGKILACFANIKISGKANVSSAVQIAQLALKHRKNKNGSQRIIVFVGSPLSEDTAALQKIGKQLKKNNVAIDVVSFGEISENNEKLSAFVKCVNSNENSHLISVPPGINPLDAIISSPVMSMGMADAAGSGSSGGGGGSSDNRFEEYGGIDPSMDPELAMAIRTSTEEARRAAEAQAQSAMQESAASGGASSSSSVGAAAFGGFGAVDEDDEEALMQRALELSMQEMTTRDHNAVTSSTGAAGDASTTDVPDSQIEEDEEAALNKALELSMQETSTLPPPPVKSSDSSSANPPLAPVQFLDPGFVSQLLGSVNVDQNDPLIQAALAQLMSAGAAPGDGKEEDKADPDSKKRKGDDL